MRGGPFCCGLLGEAPVRKAKLRSHQKMYSNTAISLRLPITPTTSSTKKISVDSGVSNGPTPEDLPFKSLGLGGEDVVDCHHGTRESEVLTQFYKTLLLAMDSEILTLSAGLFSNKFIGQETKYKVVDCPEVSSINKCAIVLKEFERRVLIEPAFLLDLLGFLDLEGSEMLKGVSRNMRATLDSLPPEPPAHSMSETTPRPMRKMCMCLKPYASSPAAFSPGLNPFCEHCEFQYTALKNIYDKFLQESFKASLVITENETEAVPKENNGYCYKTAVPTDQDCSSLETLKGSLESELIKASLPPDGSSGPRSLEASLFKSTQSMDRQSSYDSVGGGDEYITRLTNEFLEQLKKFHHTQKQSRKRIVTEKKVLSEKLKLTVEEFKDLADERNENEQDLLQAKEEITLLKNSLDDSLSRQRVLAKEVIQYKRQLQSVKCVHGSSVGCKHFVWSLTLEKENAMLKKDIQRAEEYRDDYQAKIEALELQISMLL